MLASTAVLLFGGAAAILVLEYRNPLTLAPLSFFDKVQVALFQSVTTRTAGFATLPQENLTGAASVVCLLLMFIGGSPVGTAGGVKTVTIVVLFTAAYAAVRNRNEVSLFHRNLPKQVLNKAVAVLSTSFCTVFLATVLLAAVTPAPALDVLYETVSATATVGLSKSLTPTLGGAGKIILIAAMYFGRVGPISLAIAFRLKRDYVNSIKNPTEEISVG